MITHLKTLEVSKQCVDGCVPCLVRCGVGEMVGPRNVASGEDIGDHGLQIVIGLNGVLGRDSQSFEPQTA